MLPPLSPDAIADLYDAAADGERWAGFSELVGKAAGISHVSVWTIEDGRMRDASVAESLRGWEESYRAHFSKSDPWAASMLRAPSGTVMLGCEHMREDELVKTEFYNDFARPGGMFRPMGAKLSLAPGVTAVIGSDLLWSKKRFEEHDKPRLRRLLPYIRSALQLRLRRRGENPEIGLAALDRLAFGVVLASADGRAAFANAAAERLAHAGVITLRQGMLGSAVPTEARTLAMLVNDAACGGAGGVVRLDGGLARIDGGVPGPVVTLVTPLARRPDGERGVGYAMVSLRPAWDGAAASEAMLARLFGLSPRQAAVAMAVYEGKSPAAIAAERGVRIGTVRTQLLDIFARTGARDQRDLVRLIGGLPALREPP
ncbi:MAG TPA: helix-turn-helix transcriptional regulator [Pseudolabrys sp.]|nr:helix-turn-helix transcriptional regulator [Pseudolabrys sp.]